MSENRVKVSYTLDLEEVPALVDTLLSECRQKLAKELNELKVSLHDVPQAVMQINETREALAMITTQIEDIINLNILLSLVCLQKLIIYGCKKYKLF